MLQTVVRNSEGEIIHFGPWPTRVIFGYDDEQERGVELVLNPMPDGAYEDTVEIAVKH